MRIVRVQDTEGRIRLGCQRKGTTLGLEGNPFGGAFHPTDEPLEVAKLLAPVDPPNIFAIGLNYREHAIETGKAIPTNPVVFLKATTSLNHPGDPIQLPAVSRFVDPEGELAIVIGRQCRDVEPVDARDYILGFTCANDVSERHWQAELGQWVRAKSFDTFCPLGPWIETDVPNANQLGISTIVNGDVRQASSTADMIFPVEHLVSYLSRDITLRPGTVILTGTPPGVGIARKPPLRLQAGDTVTVRIEGIGDLTNPVTEAD